MRNFYLVSGSVALNLLSLALPIMTLQVYDRILPTPGSGTLPLLAAGVIAALLLESLLRIARAWMLGWAAAAREHELSTAALGHLLKSDLSRHRPVGLGEFLHRMSAIGKIKDFESGQVTVTAVETAFIPVFIAVMFYIAGVLAFIPLGLILAFTAISSLQGRRLQAELETRETHDDTRYDFMIDALKGVHTVKSFALENLLARRYESLQEKSGAASFRAAEAATAAFNAGSVLAHAMMAAVIVAGSLLVLAGGVTTGGLIATLQLSGRLMQPAQRALALWNRYQDYQIARRKAAEIYDTPADARTPAPELPEARGTLAADGLSFGNIIRNVSFVLHAGESIAISAPDGSGKTVLMELLAGLYAPDHGRVLVDGLDIGAYPAAERARRVGLMTAEGLVFRGTIRDNLTCFGTIDSAAAQSASRLLQIDNDVARLKAGFDTPLAGNGSDNIPPGLAKRISIARVLAPRPKIILFDEADQGLDRAGYNLLFGLLGRLKSKAALVIVSSDANIIDLCDRHYTLQDGTLVKTRTHHRKVTA